MTALPVLVASVFMTHRLSGVRIPLGEPLGTVPELLFEKKQLIPPLQQLLISYHT